MPRVRSIKPIKAIFTPPQPHWVGNGFYVHGYFNDFVDENSPFLLLDYAAKRYFEPSTIQRGVGSHPHRGFETVTIALSGKIEHKDSVGNSGIISTGGVQWMTSGSGILHQEYLEKEFNEAGGDLEMVQLWINLPKAHKMTTPKYQGFDKGDIPVIEVGQSMVSIIAGEYSGQKGAANTFSPVNIFLVDVVGELDLEVIENYTTLILVLDGELEINERSIDIKNLVSFANQGNLMNLKTSSKAKILVLNAKPLDEPIAHYGPFVMNTEQQLVEAINDFNDGKFGDL